MTSIQTAWSHKLKSCGVEMPPLINRDSFFLWLTSQCDWENRQRPWKLQHQFQHENTVFIWHAGAVQDLDQSFSVYLSLHSLDLPHNLDTDTLLFKRRISIYASSYSLDHVSRLIIISISGAQRKTLYIIHYITYVWIQHR